MGEVSLNPLQLPQENVHMDQNNNQNPNWNFNVNLSGLRAPTGAATQLPEGYYKATVTDAYTLNDKPGRVIIKLTVSEGEFTGTVRTTGLGIPKSEQDGVRRNAVAFGQAHDVARHHVAAGYAPACSVANHRGPWAGKAAEGLQDMLASCFLDDADGNGQGCKKRQDNGVDRLPPGGWGLGEPYNARVILEIVIAQMRISIET